MAVVLPHGVISCGLPLQWREDSRKGRSMAAMKPRTGDGPLEVTKEGRGIVLRMPLEGGGRLVVEMTPDEAAALRDAIAGCEGVPSA
jgi:hypothetical protein